ncbi:MAG: phosphoribosylformylglycinamidine synthase subunit PurQ [Opitutaceae bacterium]
MSVGVIQFPGSNCDQDAVHAFTRGLGVDARMLWHKDQALGEIDVLVVPGGFSYGDYLRCGAIARFSPIMKAVAAYAERGGVVIGICNGFQILCEASLLPGALIWNSCLEYRCMTPYLAVEDSTPHFNRKTLGHLIRLPIGHGEGNFRIDPEGLARLEGNRQILLRYVDAEGKPSPGSNPNGSISGIAGIRNQRGNVFGMMPHPDRAFETFHPSIDGRKVLRAILDTAAAAAPSAV